MTDKEMLEFAAKAAGYVIEYHTEDGTQVYIKDAPLNKDGEPDIFLWRPRVDDGDALRLAVKLSISFSDDYTYPNGEHCIRVGCIYGNTLYGDSEPCGNDPYAATRLAIVRTAAEIGNNL